MNSESAVIPEEFADRRIRSFVSRQGRISSGQKRSYETLFHLYGVQGGEGFLECNKIFGNDNQLVIEIGFGMGKATAAIAHNNHGINYLGIEVHKPGIGKLLGEIERLELINIRIVEGDAVEILEKLKPNFLLSAPKHPPRPLRRFVYFSVLAFLSRPEAGLFRACGLLSPDS